MNKHDNLGRIDKPSDSSDTSTTAKVPQYILEGLLSEPFSVASLLGSHKKGTRIQFETKEDVGKGIMLLLNNDYTVIGCKNGIYRLTSEEQAELLNKNGIKYHVVP